MNDLNFAMDLLAFFWWRDYEYRLEHPPARSLREMLDAKVRRCIYQCKPNKKYPKGHRCKAFATYRAQDDGHWYCYQHSKMPHTWKL